MRLNRFISSATFILCFICTVAKSEPLRFGVIADVHFGWLSDVDRRLQLFINKMNDEQVDFIIQLGDFNLHSDDRSTQLKEIWNGFHGPKFHVLGNHEMDLHNKSEVQKFWSMDGNYYSIDIKGFRLIILDGNHIKKESNQFLDYTNGNYFNYKSIQLNYFGDKQLAWYREQVNSSSFPVITFSHQILLSEDGASPDTPMIRRINQEANNGDESKVILSLFGHGHKNKMEQVNGIPYVEIPTASHEWIPGEGAQPYSTVRFSIVEIDKEKGTIHIKGFSEPFEFDPIPSGKHSTGSTQDYQFTFKIK